GSDVPGPAGGESGAGVVEEPVEDPPALGSDFGLEDSAPDPQVGDQQAPDPPAGVDESIGERDAYWTWRLFSDGFTMEEVCQIRKLNRRQIACHLQAAAARGRSVSPSWQS
ncbi:hypothetical protein, partial [Stieleria sp.]|uniref:hypothetical protein n=1 Tax=Stieleria sp. TaxID=2795976 RepID=UPI003564958B